MTTNTRESMWHVNRCERGFNRAEGKIVVGEKLKLLCVYPKGFRVFIVCIIFGDFLQNIFKSFKRQKEVDKLNTKLEYD